MQSSNYQHTTVKVYHGFGHMHLLTLYGHVQHNRFNTERNYNNNILSNIIHLVKLFCVVPVAGGRLRLLWNEQQFFATTGDDGFFKFEWSSIAEVPAGWHGLAVQLLDDAGNTVKTGQGEIFVPHSTQFGFISDIDDTVMVSHSATIFRRLRVLFTRNPKTRKAFTTVRKHYLLLSEAHTTPDVPNPFFYVSSSEWNLYDDLTAFFDYNHLPKGAFLLSQVKQWFQLFTTGKTKHEGKLLRIYRILQAFPRQQFVLLGDNSQADPDIYAQIALKYPKQIFAVYIRNIVTDNGPGTREILQKIERQKIFTCLFSDNEAAIAHSRNIGLIK